MAHRQEEKEARRAAREAAEAAEARKAARRRRAQMVFGGVLALGLVAAVVVVIVLGGGGADGEESAADGRQAEATVKLPDPVETNLDKAAEAAGCELVHAKFEGAEHEEREFKPADYQTNPPTSGTHFPEWYDDGVYEPGAVPELGKLVHTLEHGRINIQYKPGTPDKTVKELEAFVAEKTGYHLLLYENTTAMPYAVAATAWTQLLGCNEMNPKVFDALRTFYDRYVDKGPEQVA